MNNLIILCIMVTLILLYIIYTRKSKPGKKVMINTENNQMYSDVKKKYADT